MTREQMIDEAVRRVDVPAYWAEFLEGVHAIHFGPQGRPISKYETCRAHTGMIRAEFRRIKGEQDRDLVDVLHVVAGKAHDARMTLWKRPIRKFDNGLSSWDGVPSV